MIDAAVQRDVDGIPKGSHYARVPPTDPPLQILVIATHDSANEGFAKRRPLHPEPFLTCCATRIPWKRPMRQLEAFSLPSCTPQHRSPGLLGPWARSVCCFMQAEAARRS